MDVSEGGGGDWLRRRDGTECDERRAVECDVCECGEFEYNHSVTAVKVDERGRESVRCDGIDSDIIRKKSSSFSHTHKMTI